jgi:hypothetical protein
VSKIGSFDNVLVKNGNLERLLKQNNLLLENLFASMNKDYERNFYPMKFHITALASKSALEPAGTVINFPFSYFIKTIEIRSETNKLAGIALEINKELFPSQGFLLTTVNADSKLWYDSVETETKSYKLNKFVDKPFDLQIHYVNTHTSNQTIYLLINGFRVSLDDLLKTIKKNNVRYR